MGRTIRRNVASVGINNLDEKYENMTEFHGLCTNKNYVGIDQNTFSEVENMYVNQQNELSTRPTLKEIKVLDSDYIILDIVKINERLFYHIQDTSDGKYYIMFEYTYDGLKHTKELEVTEKVHVCWFNSGYAIFTEDNIYSIRFDKWGFPLVFQADAAVYTPITQVISGTETADNESPNLFTSSYIKRYLFTYGNETTYSPIVGEKVDITIGDTTYHDVVFQEYNDKVFYKRFGTVTNVDVVLSRQNSSGTNVFVGYKYDSLEYYISINGTIFVKDSFPDNATAGQIPVLSDDANTLYILGDVMYDYDELEYYVNLYSKNLSTTSSAIVNQEWSIERIILKQKTYNLWSGKQISDGKYVMYTNVCYFDYVITGDKRYVPYYGNPFGYSTGTGNVAYVLPVPINMRGYITNNNDSSIDGWTDAASQTSNYFVMLLKSNNIVNTDFVTIPLQKNYCNKLRFLATQTDKSPFVVLAKTLSSNYELWYFLIDREFNLYRRFGHDRSASGQNGSVIRFITPMPYLNRINIVPASVNSDYYNVDINVSMTSEDNTYRRLYNEMLMIHKFYWKENVPYEANVYTDSFVYPETPSSSYADNRAEFPFVPSNEDVEIRTISVPNKTAKKFVLSYASDNFMTEYFVYYNGTTINYMFTNGVDLPVYMNGEIFTWYYNDYVYSNQYDNIVTVDYTVKGEMNYVIPYLSNEFVVTTIALDNYVYTSQKVDAGDINKVGLLHGDFIYVPESFKIEYPGKVTAFANFSQTSLGVFLENSVYELQYDNNSEGIEVYLSTKSKLQLGNRDGADVLVSYDGTTIFVPTLKGLSGLTYKDFVQSTEQVYNYLTESILDNYYEFAVEPVKIYQYKDWLILYRKNYERLLVYDVRTASWWPWMLPYKVNKLIMIDEELYAICLDYNLYKFRFNELTVYDNDLHTFDWSFVTQMLHFGAPNNYKHIRSLSIFTSQEGRELRFKMFFKNYRNLYNPSDTDTMEYNINELTTMIKRVNFIKTNAFQFGISNDVTDKYPKPLVTPNIAIKYRITEKVR